MPQAFIHAGSLHYAAVLGNVTEEHGQSAILGIGMFDVTDAAIGTVGIKCPPLFRLTTHLCREPVARSRLIDAISLCIDSTVDDAVFLKSFSKRHTIDTNSRAVNESAFIQFVQNAENATGASAFLHRILLGVRSQFA